VAAGNDNERLAQIIASAGVVGGRFGGLEYLPDVGGAFSLCFGARDTVTAESVFLKFLNPKHNGDLRGRFFQREVRICRQLEGRENIVQIRGEPGVLTLELTHMDTGLRFPMACQYLPMERAKRSFAQYLLLQRRPPSLHRRLGVIHDAAKGVGRLHRVGFCHRDLKPDNILLFRGGLAKLGDLGTCRARDENDGALEADYLGQVGQVGYTAPEILCGGWNKRELYPGADWFSLGAVLFEAVTGFPLYVAVGLHGEDLWDMVAHFRPVPENARLPMYQAIVSDIAGEYPVPSVRDYAASDPFLARASDSTLDSLDHLVRGLCHFDFRRRTSSFPGVLRAIEISRRHALLDEQRRAQRILRGQP